MAEIKNRVSEEFIIQVEVFGYLNNVYPHWEENALLLKSISAGKSWPVSDEEISVLKDSLCDIKPIKNERWHIITLKRIISKNGGYDPDEHYYESVKIELTPRTCITCGKQLSKEDSDLIDVHGVDPYCSQYCAEFGNGVPMPYSQGANVFDKFWNEKT